MLVEIALLILAVVAYYYHKVTKNFGFFKDQGVPYSKPSFPFGSIASRKMMSGEINFMETEVYTVTNEFPNEKVFGIFLFGQPIYVINDQELAKLIMIKDFEYFMDRRAILDINPINNAFLTNLKGAEWKLARSMMSGVFTSGRLKDMFHHINKVGYNFADHLSELAMKGEEVDIREVHSKMALDAIATSGFGIESNSFKEPDNTFRHQAMVLVGAPGYVSQFIMLKVTLMMLFPWMAKFFSLLDTKALDFFANIVRRTQTRRKEYGTRRGDIIDIISEEFENYKTKAARTAVTFEGEFEKDAAITTGSLASLADSEFDEETLQIAGILVMFLAGFDTTTMGFSMICHKMALYPEFQDRMRDELLEVLGEDGKVTFDKLQDLKLMGMFINESLRMDSIFPAHERLCTKDYKIPGTEIVVPKGNFVRVFVKDIIESGDNFVNPGKFDPENFNPENKPNKFGFQTFGQGPRNCIGMRYALLVIKISLVHLLRGHRLVRVPKTVETLRLDPANPQVFKGGVWVKIEQIDH